MQPRGISFTKENAKTYGSMGGKLSKRTPLNNAWREELEKESENDSILNTLFNVLIEESKKGNLQAIKELLDRAYGKPSQAPSEFENNVVEVKLISGEELIA